MTDGRSDADLALLNRHVAMLREHFDAVQILCSRQQGDATVSATVGDGNWFARVGLAQEWLSKAGEGWRRLTSGSGWRPGARKRSRSRILVPG